MNMVKAEAIKAFVEVVNQHINKVNKRGHISLSLNLFLYCWEVCIVSLQVFFEHLKLPLKGADICHQFRNSIVLTLHLQIHFNRDVK